MWYRIRSNDCQAPTPLPTSAATGPRTAFQKLLGHIFEVCVVDLERVEGRKVFLKGHVVIESELRKVVESTALFVEVKR